jgi:hypothetical protein
VPISSIAIPSKFIQIGIFGLKIYDLATLVGGAEERLYVSRWILWPLGLFKLLLIQINYLKANSNKIFSDLL